MDEYIWLEEPLHKNKINFDFTDLNEYKVSFDGSIIAYKTSLVGDKKSIVNDIKMYKLGYKEYEMPKSIDNHDDLLKVLILYSE